MADHPCALPVASGQEGGPAGRADARAGVEVGQAQSLRCEGVDVGRHALGGRSDVPVEPDVSKPRVFKSIEWLCGSVCLS